MADDPKVGPEAHEESGEAVDTAPVTAPESGGDSAGETDATQAADAARDEYLAKLAANAAREVVTQLLREQGNGSGQGTHAVRPPTPAGGAVAELHAERQVLDAEEARLQRAIEAEGLTAGNLYAHQQLVQKDARWLAKVNLEATRQSEREREVSGAGQGDAWRNFVAGYPAGTDISLLRDAFEKRQERELAKTPTKKPPVLSRREPERVVVDVSGASEVSAGERKARTMTAAQIEARKEHLRETNMDAYIQFGRELRSGAVIRKG